MDQAYGSILDDPMKSSGIGQGTRLSNEEALEWIRVLKSGLGLLESGSGGTQIHHDWLHIDFPDAPVLSAYELYYSTISIRAFIFCAVFCMIPPDFVH